MRLRANTNSLAIWTEQRDIS